VQRRDAFPLIDGLRGIAAIAVFSIHWQSISAPWLLASSGYLAVDLFFLLSGIVIAHAYDARISSGDLNTVRFMLIRIIRFWPLYALATLLAGALACMAIATGRIVYYPSYAAALASTGLTLLFIPQHWSGELFQLNVPYWSLLCELIANLIFVLAWRRLSLGILAVIVAIGGIGVVASGLAFGQLSGGGWWDTAHVGLVRVIFSFFLGVIIYRTVPRASAVSQTVAIACAATLIAVFAIQPGAWRVWYDLVCVILLFPAIGVLVMRIGVSGPVARVFKMLGAASYGVYVLHLPMLIVVSAIVTRTGRTAESIGPLLFLVVCPALVAAVLILDRWFDRPVRKYLTSRLGLDAPRAASDPEPL